MTNLFEIAKKFPSYAESKEKTGFLSIYASYLNTFKDKEINILEIGVAEGKSLNLWRNFFSKAKICGIDIQKMNFNIDGVELITADQTDIQSLKKICDKYKSFDIIIDDGCHISKNVIISFNFLFDYLNHDGLYVIEDLNTSYLPNFGGSRINLLKRKTSMNYLKSLTDSINYEKNDKPFYSRKKFDGMIKYIHFYQNIAFIKKGFSNKIFYKNQSNKKNLLDKIKKLISSLY